MLSVQPVSVYRQSFKAREYDYDDIETQRLEKEKKFYETQKREINSVVNDKHAIGPVGKFAKVLLRVTTAVLAGVGMAIASNMSFNILNKMVKHIKLDKALKWTGKKAGAGFNYVGKGFKKAFEKTADTKLGKKTAEKAAKYGEIYKKTKFAKHITDISNWVKKQKAYETVSKKINKFNDWVFSIKGKDVKTAAANTLGAASGITVLVNGDKRS